MKLVIAKQIHSSFSAFSSEDVFLYRVIDNLTQKTLKKHLPPDYSEMDKDEVADIVTVFVEADKTFYDRALKKMGFTNYGNTPEFAALIDKYKKEGWIEEPDDINKARMAKYAREEEARKVQRKKDGYVMTEEDGFVGGFSNELMSLPVLAQYLERRVAFGYIGHSCRKYVTDTYLEAEFMKLATPANIDKREILATWLTSTDGRHFGDSLEDLSDEEAKKKIKKYLPEIFNLGFIYSRKEHEGTAGSTHELKEKHADQLLKS